MTAADFAAFRPLLWPALEAAARRFDDVDLGGADFDAVVKVAEWKFRPRVRFRAARHRP